MGTVVWPLGVTEFPSRPNLCRKGNEVTGGKWEFQVRHGSVTYKSSVTGTSYLSVHTVIFTNLPLNRVNLLFWQKICPVSNRVFIKNSKVIFFSTCHLWFHTLCRDFYSFDHTGKERGRSNKLRESVRYIMMRVLFWS